MAHVSGVAGKEHTTVINTHVALANLPMVGLCGAVATKATTETLYLAVQESCTMGVVNLAVVRWPMS